MHILSPANSPKETKAIIDEGAGEIYCGVMTPTWKNSYSNVASPNRREWAVSNMTSYDDLTAIVDIAHHRGVRVFLTLNALYTGKQYTELQKFVALAMRSGADAVIAADIGLLLSLRDMGWERDIHVSTGGTSFNDETVAFYRELGAARVIIPRQNRTSEITAITRNNPDMEIETFIMNRGCKNIDGFCTFHHGVNEVRIPLWWQLPKKMHCDYYLLSMMKQLPLPVRGEDRPLLHVRIRRRLFSLL